MRARTAAVLIAVSAALCYSQPGPHDMVGVLRGNDYSARVEQVTWLTRTGIPISQLTPGWSAEPGQMDTWHFPTLPEGPAGIIVDYFVGGFYTAEFDSLVQDSWYVLPVQSPDSVPPEVKFYNADSVGCAERPPVPRRPGALSVVSNPARGRAAFRYDGPPGPLAVYAGDGRLVALLPRARGGPDAAAAWDGTDHRGAKQPDGVYYCRALSGAGHPAVRFVLLRD